jgi:transcription elongation factor Elf1
VKIEINPKEKGVLPWIEFKPCPFCKNYDCVVDKTSMHYYVICLKCEARGPLSDTVEEAKTAWSNRSEA